MNVKSIEELSGYLKTRTKQELVDMIIEKEKCNITSDNEVTKLIRERRPNYDIECFYVILLDKQNSLVNMKCIARGTNKSCYVSLENILRFVLSDKRTCNVVFAHNHPSGDCEPSTKDIEFANDLRNLLHLIGIKVNCNIVFTRNDSITY